MLIKYNTLLVALKQEHIGLACAELQALFEDAHIKLIKDTSVALVVHRSQEVSTLVRRSAHIEYATDVQEEYATPGLVNELKKLSKINEPAWVTVDRAYKSSIMPQHIIDAIPVASADKENPSLRIHIVVTRTKSFLCHNIYKPDTSYLLRKPQHKPAHHPSSIDPRLARTLINLSGVQRGKIWDPFCGVGGILVEASLMGLYCIGSDIDEVMLQKARTNLHYYNIHNYTLLHADARATNVQAPVIVTDVPYGKNTKNIDDQLYSEFLNNVKQAQRLVIVFPNTVDPEKLYAQANRKIQLQQTLYIHKSLSKIVTVAV